MSSTREKILAASLLAAATLVGCQRAYVERPLPLAPEPLAADEAMQIRQWAPSSAMYPNGAIDAGPTGFSFKPRRDMAEYRYYFADIGLYLGNLVLLPYRLVQTPPNRTVTYRGEWIRPTYTANPPLPPDPLELHLESQETEGEQIVPVPDEMPPAPQAPSDSPATTPS